MAKQSLLATDGAEKRPWGVAGPLRLPDDVKAKLSVLYIAKHALAGGAFDIRDGSHAVYHHSIRKVLESIGLRVVADDNFEAIGSTKNINYLFSLLNRADFFNSEVLAATLAERFALPYLGARPILRAVSDDKHFTKLLARDAAVPTPEWSLVHRGVPYDIDTLIGVPAVVKPNNSSASWGLKVCTSIAELKDHIDYLHTEGHDALIERLVPGLDVAVSIIGPGPAWTLPLVIQSIGDDGAVISYEAKRGFAKDIDIRPFEEKAISNELTLATAAICQRLGPFDYGRFDFRVDVKTGRWHFLEANVSCNLAENKAIAKSAAMVDVSHAELVETILVHSLQRNRFLITD